MECTLQQYDQIISECLSIYTDKVTDYGVAWRILRLPSLTDQIYIKAQRIRSIQEHKEQKISESVYSEFIGILNYCVMALIQIERGVAATPDLSATQAIDLYKEQITITKTLMTNKNHDYGEAWRLMRISSMTDLIIQKIFRIKQIEDNQGATIISEGIDANYQDIINYCVFAMILSSEK